MPTYEYACKDCGNELEVVQSFTDEALTECPSCNGRLRKVFGTVGISFKGSGFYKNDSRSTSKSSSKQNVDGGGTDTKPDSSSTTGSNDNATSKADSSKPGSASSDAAKSSQTSGTGSKPSSSDKAAS